MKNEQQAVGAGLCSDRERRAERLSSAAERIGRLYDLADADARRMVKLALRRFDEGAKAVAEGRKWLNPDEVQMLRDFRYLDPYGRAHVVKALKEAMVETFFRRRCEDCCSAADEQ